MSIDDAIEELCAQGFLAPYRVEPSVPTDNPPRYVYLTEEIIQYLDGLAGDPRDFPPDGGTPEEWWPVDTLLMNFVDGMHLKVRHPNLTVDPRGQPTYLAQIQRAPGDPKGIWELRVPTPIRIFGGFFKKDHFVGLTCREHEGLDYRAEALACAELWDEKLGRGTRLTEGKIPNAYLSTATVVPTG